ncbi:hypothetical protein [Kordia jejudonensis]|uniref:hypothetical protein n=1 Tax=Kordia jejudonensis TaxID=1348245 RepID=UPI0006298A50|nr:hypothetical protein [Kordia jejudonensis]
MDGLGIIFLIVGGIIVLYNIIIQFSNLTKIIQYTFATNSLSNYWEYYFKTNFSLRAIISSIIGLVIAIAMFFIILPFVLYRKFVLKNDVESQLASGLIFDYKEEYNTVEVGEIFNTNIDFLHIKDIHVATSGMLKLDLMSIIAKISEYCEANNKKVDFAFMEKVKLSDKSVATVPVMLTVNERKYPLYLIYTPEHQAQYNTLKKKLFESGYRDTIYFSIDLNNVRVSNLK